MSQPTLQKGHPRQSSFRRKPVAPDPDTGTGEAAVHLAALQAAGFTILEERPPSSLLRRYWVTQNHVLGLLFGGGIAFIRAQQAKGGSFLVSLLRVLLWIVRPLLNKNVVDRPFPVQFRMRLEMLGPTYIKLGQILSLREDLLPTSITVELQNLLDRLPVVSFPRYKELIATDLECDVESVFSWIDPIPLGSASLAQTHRAMLPSGEDVVLKVIKPWVRETIIQDTKLLRLLGVVLQQFLEHYQPRRTIDEFCTYTLREVDLRYEADNAETFAVNFRGQSDVRFPRVFRAYSGESVLCMEYFHGAKPNARTAANLVGSERKRVVELGVSSIVQMIFQDGFFHADLHPGNLVIFEDTSIGFLDLGMVGRLDEATRRAMLYYFYSLVMGDAENAARVLTAVAIKGPGATPEAFRRELADLNRRWLSSNKYHHFSTAQLVLQSITRAGRHRVYYPEAIILMIKALVTVEGVASIMEPELELTSVSKRYIYRILRTEFDPVQLFRNSLLVGPEVLDVMLRSPLILAQMLQQLGAHYELPQRQETRLRPVIVFGAYLVAFAILVDANVSWPVWVGAGVVSLVVLMWR